MVYVVSLMTFYNEQHISFRVIIIVSEVFYLVEVHMHLCLYMDWGYRMFGREGWQF